MNSSTVIRRNYVRLALFACLAIVFGVAVWRAGFATPSPFVNTAEAHTAPLTIA